MVIAFFIEEMNLRGVANSIYLYSKYNEKILKNKSIIFYNKINDRHDKSVIKKFEKKFKVIGIKGFAEIDKYSKVFKIKYIYTQTGGEKTNEVSQSIKTFVHFVYPQKFSEIHGYKYVCVSNWLSKQFFNNKIAVLPYIVEVHKSKKNLKKQLRLKKDQIIFGCHGGESSFDLKFVKDALIETVKANKNIVFIFLNIEKFYNHPRIIFLKGSSDEKYKKEFLNTCDAMIYGRSQGESFGMSCAEFAILKKLIISYKFNRHRSHIDYLDKEYYAEYSSKKKLIKILKNYKKKSLPLNKKNNYLKCTPKFISKKFKKILLTDEIENRVSFFDYFSNYLGFLKMNYFYFRHKLYNHYYKFFESKFF